MNLEYEHKLADARGELKAKHRTRQDGEPDEDGGCCGHANEVSQGTSAVQRLPQVGRDRKKINEPQTWLPSFVMVKL